MNILVTGHAGFIGSNLVHRLFKELKEGTIVGIDDLNDYYEPMLENPLDFVNTLQEELVRAGVLPKDYDFEANKLLVPMQPGDVPTAYADATALE